MKKLLYLLYLVTAVSLSQESSYSDQFSKIVQTPNSPEAEAFTKYGDIGTNLFTGAPNISVPLYTIKGKEMDFPISLTYDASEVKVRQIATNVGLGWNLNVGARISRQTRGLPDEITGGVQGYESLANANTRNDVLNYLNISTVNSGELDATAALGGGSFANSVSNVEDYFGFLMDVQKGKKDIEQDYFSINGMGLNETLWMDIADYEPIPLNDPNLKAEQIADNTWKIIDANGTIYIFGQDLNCTSCPYNTATSHPVEKVRRYSDRDTQDSNPLDIQYISSWLLSKIISNNGKDVYHIEYTNHSEFDGPDYFEIINQTITHPFKTNITGEVEFEGSGSYPQNNKISSVKSYYTQQFIEAIYHNGKKVITFQFGDRDDVHYNGTGKKITGLKVYEDEAQSGAQPLKEISFEQSYFGDENSSDHYAKRLKLDKVSLSSSNPENYYSFHYNSPENVPHRKNSYAFDKMGFFNGQDSPTPFLKFVKPNHIDLPGNNRKVSPQASKVGVLEKIVYPTGGATEFVYENHNNGSDHFPGLRIKELKSYTDNGILAIQKQYEYFGFKENYVPVFDEVISTQANPCNTDPFTSGSPLQRFVMAPNTDGGAYIGYQKVREYLYDNGQNDGYVEYSFNTYGEDPWDSYDTSPYLKQYDSNTKLGKPSGKTIKNNQGTLQLEEIQTYDSSPPNLYSSDALVLWNNPSKQYSFVKTYIDNSNRLIIKTDGGGVCGGFTCNSCPNGGVGGTGIFQMASNYCNGEYANEFCFPVSGWASLELIKIPIKAYRMNLVSSVTKEYFTNGMVETTTTHEYSQNGLFLEATTTTNTDGTSQRIEYTYPLDITNPTSAETKLINDNKLYIPIITKTLKVDGGNTNLLSTQRTDYHIYGSGQDTYSLPRKLQFEKGGTGSNLEDRIIYNKYDASGNPVEVFMEDGEPTCYIWGYDHKYPVAKIENIDYSQVPLISSIEGETDEVNLLSLLDQLRNHTNTAHSLVTTYTYIPGVGVSTITDPSGNCLRYVYDSDNRLKFVLDKNDKVVSKNDYHLRSKIAISGAEIIEIGQGIDQGSPYVDFEVITTGVTPSSINTFEFSWSTENGINPINNNDNSTVRIFYDCENLEGEPLEVSCLVSDGDEEYASEKVSELIIPDSCIILGNIIVHEQSNDGGGYYVIFKIDNLQGGDATNTYNWTLLTANDPGQGNESILPDGRFKVYYNCGLMLDEIQVKCEASSNNGAQGLFYGDATPCILSANIQLVKHASGGNKFLEFIANASGGHPDGFSYYWSFEDPLCYIDYVQIEQVFFPFNDEQGSYYLTYDCSNCLNQAPGNFPLTIYLIIEHSNGSILSTQWDNGGSPISGTCGGSQ
tara:strand:- start:59943 stop:63989 length:4047 start_codon:yes stop_codon:yes gene_type:complete